MKDIRDFFNVVFEDNNFIAINKTTNLSTEKNNFYENSVEDILKRFGEPYSLLKRCGIVHRIDRNTTGLLLVAKNSCYQEFLLGLFREKKIRKFYLSLNSGSNIAKSGSVKMFLKKRFADKQRIRMVIGGPTDKFVEIKFRKISDNENLNLFRIEAVTGKTHQIRLAFESIKAPIYNDEIYSNGIPRSSDFTSEGHYLHSYMLKFSDGSRNFEIFAKLPEFFSRKISDEKIVIEDKEILPLI